MPKKPVLPETNEYLVVWSERGIPHWVEYVGAKLAVEGYRYLRTIHGDNCRLVKVVLNYGQEI